ncbi:MAG: hypothetical protein COX19_03210 [Desulfobacterales bacterium CG23_combo_of_CG06-09_8_20_14_all_51_8]|nr:MAG: hypothetical protein COX19_03210 [Desulfobacterales bacterium CG23_combo_of_CG06-09_8_20_14_all_51_8]
MRQLLFLFFLLSLVTSCASIPGRGPDTPEDHIKAENRMMNKNLDLALRENEVLKTENMGYKSDVATLNEKVLNLNAEIQSVNKKYNEDMAQMNESYEDLCLRFESLERESDVTIAELTDINMALEKKNADEITKFKGLLQAQSDSFNSERDSLKAEFASRMMEMEKQLASVKQMVQEKDAAILLLVGNLKKANELAVHLESVVKERDETLKKANELAVHLEGAVKKQDETLQRKDKEYQELVTSNRKLQADIDEKQAKIAELIKNLPPAPEPAKPITTNK